MEENDALTLALGNTHRKEGNISCRVRFSESLEYWREVLKFSATSPRPWRKTTVWVCGVVAGMMTGMDVIVGHGHTA